MIGAIMAFGLGAAGLAPAPCPTGMSARLAGANPAEGAAHLIRFSQAGDSETARCAEQLAVSEANRHDGLDQRFFVVARAVALERLGRPADAVALMEPLVGFQHHTITIPADFHAVLSQAYAASGRLPEAEGQRRLAVAAIDADPPFAMTPEQIRDLPQQTLTIPVVAVAPANPEPNLLDLGSIRIEGETRTYQTLLVLPLSDAPEAIRRIERRVDCQTLRGELVSIERLNDEGDLLATEAPDDTREDFSASVDHRRRMVCAATPAPEGPASPQLVYRLFGQEGT
ncbi:hypothetical protein ACIQC9_06775 [Brevundimonas sp. NPDC092305]|uniref:hypothetical protein n=1 Tax=Brevundimonas sp. NPDC092305 TaxID=3363957 RepID=UPI0038198612